MSILKGEKEKSEKKRTRGPWGGQNPCHYLAALTCIVTSPQQSDPGVKGEEIFSKNCFFFLKK